MPGIKLPVLWQSQSLIAYDDLIFVVPPVIFIHTVWGILDLLRIVQPGLDVSKVDTSLEPWIGKTHQDLLHYDAYLCFGTIPLDFLIFCLAAAGPILKPRRCQRCLHIVFVVRTVLTWAIILNYAILIGPAVHATIKYLRWKGGDIEIEHVAEDMGKEDQDERYVLLLLAVTISRVMFYTFVVFIGILLTLSPKTWMTLGTAGIRTVLLLIGVRRGVVQSMITILTVDLAGSTPEEVEVSPTDWAFGLLLVAGSQEQWPLAYEPDQPKVELEDGWVKGVHCRRKKTDGRLEVSPHFKKACSMSGIDRPLVPFDPASPADQRVVWETVRLMPYASGIYGQVVCLSFIKDVVYPGTHVPTLRRCCRAIWYSLSCCGASCSLLSWLRRLGCCFCPFRCYDHPAGITEGDWSCAFHEDALLRSVEAGSRRFGSAPPTLLFASWKNLGPTTSPPIAVFADHGRKELIVTVRGTADVKDCIADAGARPLFFDPLGKADKGANRKMPFDSENDWYVHGTMLLCMEDALHRLKHNRILEQALDGDCCGYDIVVTGHSLGAGVACLLALQLKANFVDIAHVRFVGFETPGGLLSKRLSDETQRLEWVTVACAFDWVPRIGIRNLLRIKKAALRQMKHCSRSKLQLTMLLVAAFIKGRRCLCCFRRPLARLFQCLGGGPLTYDLAPDEAAHESEEALLQPEANGEDAQTLAGWKPFPELWPGGDILYLVPVQDETYCCRFLECNRDWTAVWADPRDLNELILSLRAIEFHVPWVYEHAVHKVAKWFEEYEQCKDAKHDTAHTPAHCGFVRRGHEHTRRMPVQG